MRRFAVFVFVAATILAWANTPCVAQDFKPYAGSRLDETASREASAAAPGKRSDGYFSSSTVARTWRAPSTG